MPSSCRMALLLLLLLLPTGPRAQSGDADAEPRITCTSDITLERSQLTCQLLGGNSGEDDEDGEGDAIERMSVCYVDYDTTARTKCEEGSGNTISPSMSVLSDFALTVHLRRGGNITAMFNLQKIVKPRRPSVQNVTFNVDSNQAVISIQTPYHNDYLKLENQLFQLHICTASGEMTQNLSASGSMKVDMQSLKTDAEYRVRVRAIPISHLQGSWSEWSDTFGFRSPADAKVDKWTPERQQGFVLVLCLASLVVVTVSAGFLWKNKIFTYMWPSIPHPKDTLVQICKPNKGLLLNFNPEVFSALKVYPMENADEDLGEETEPSVAPAAADGAQSNDPGSTQSSDCRSTTSVGTEELELSALMSRSSSDGEESLQSISPSPLNILQLGDGRTPQADQSSGGNQVDLCGVGQQEEAYVTMSSFYQIK